MFIIQEEISNLNHLEELSNASGDDSMPARNAACHFKCNFKVKSKRAACWQDCDKRFPRSEGQEQRRDEQSTRRTARNIKRDSIEECKELFDKGEITKEEEINCIKGARFDKRQTIKEDGGGKLLTRVGRGFNKVNPISASARTGVLMLTKRNVAGFATRLAPALVPESEAKQKFTPEAIELSKKGWEKVKKAWKNLGGNEFKLRDSILEGFKKKPEKIPRSADKSSIDGSIKYSNAMGFDDIMTLVGAGLSLFGIILKLINNARVKKDPFKSADINPDYTKAMSEGIIDDSIPTDPNDPIIDPKTGKWIDPKTGKPIDPRTGQQLILGMNPYLAIGIGAIILVSGGIVIYKVSQK